jgi:hypothetical protein
MGTEEVTGRNCMTMLAVAVTVASSLEAAPIDFNQDIRPMLSAKCFNCHGPHADARKAGLRLDTKAGLFGNARSGRPIVMPGNVEDSVLVQRLFAVDPDDRMPPADALHQLSTSDRALIQAWVNVGAPWSKHWSFIKPKSQPMPSVIANWLGNEPIDRFVQAMLHQKDLSPSPQADRETLLRRVSFDLTGLPPSVAQLDAFLADNRPEAYEHAVDALLASPRFGEHMATPWLDLARYADTYGYQNDVGRSVWQWRDWVIGAFNDNLPFDAFLTWQLAGDLLPNPTREQQLATTFNRLHRQTNEGGSVNEEYRVAYVADRVDTFGAAMLGLTTQCARCHDHKFDPISQREYYELFAFFDNIDESGLYSHFTSAVPTPTLTLPTPLQQTQLEALGEAVELAEATLLQRRHEARPAFAQWSITTEGPLTVPGLVAHYPLDVTPNGTLANLIDASMPAKTSLSPLVAQGNTADGLLLSGDNNVHFPGIAAFSRSTPFSLSLYVQVPDVKSRAVVMHRSRAWTDAGSQGYQLLLEDGKLSWSLVHFWPGDAISIKATEPMATGRFVHVVVTADGSSTANGLALYIDGEAVPVEVIKDNLYKGITGGGPGALTIGERFRDNGLAGGIVDDVMVFDRCLTPIEVAHVHDGESLNTALASAPNTLLAYYLATASDPTMGAASAVVDARAAFASAQNGVGEIMAMRDLPIKRQTYVLDRGEYNSPREAVSPATPAAVLPFDPALPSNRLGLAQWVTDRENPLTARVAVNRLWAQVFGRGLVVTPGDFGNQGVRPTHPALLDALALDFIDSGWDTKAMLRRMVLSETYKQQSESTAAAWQSDPGNQWLARGPSRRLTAERMRDQALAASGLLVEHVGGAGVFPYQPPGLWREKSDATYPQGKGDALYRRSLYTYWKRTSPPPSMMIFDAAKRDICIADRGSTSTPLQALVLLNDVQFVEAARVLAERAWHASKGDAQASIVFAFRSLTGRMPDDGEVAVLGSLFQSQRQALATDSEAALLLASVGERPRDTSLNAVDIAALTATCSTMMNTDAATMQR